MNERIDEPVGRFAKFTDGVWREVTDGSVGVPLYDHPKEWVGLTNEEIKKAVLDEHNGGFALMTMMRDEVIMKEVRQAINLIAKAIEAKLKDKNNP